MSNISQVTLPDNTTYDLADATLRSKIKVIATVEWDTSTNTGTINKSYLELYSAVANLNSTLPAIEYFEHGDVLYSVPTHYYLPLYSYDSEGMVLTFKTPGNGYGYEIRISRSYVPQDPGYEDKIYRTRLTPTASWGNISGTLSNQTDLSNALNAKQDTLTAGTNITIDANNVINASGCNYTSVGHIIDPDLWNNNVYNIPMSGMIQAITNIVILTYPSTMSDSDYEMLKKADIRITGLTLSNLTIKALGEVPTTSFTLMTVIWGV